MKFSLAFLAGVAAIFFWRVIFLGQVLLPADMIYTAEPWKSELRSQPLEEVWNPNLTDQIWQMYPIASYTVLARQVGGLLWDPYVLGGMPALARGDLFSNPIFHLLSGFLPIATALSWVAICNVFLASLFMVMLLYQMGAGWFGALVASLSFAYGGYLIGWLSLTHIASGMVWLPLIFWAFERALRLQNWRWAIAGALAFLFHVLSGYILWAFYGAITLLLWALYRSLATWLQQRDRTSASKPVLYAGLILGVGSLLAAPQLLLTIQLYFNTVRTEPIASGAILEVSGHILRLLAPNLYGNGVHGHLYQGQLNYPETNLYWGVLPLLFIPASWMGKNRVLGWGMSALGLAALLAVYNLSPFRQIISLIFPLFLNTFPARIFYIVSFAWAVAAGLGASWLAERTAPLALRFFSVLSGLLAVALLIFWFMAGHNRLVQPSIDEDSLRVSIILLLACWLLLGVYSRDWIGPNLFKAISLGIIVFDLFWVGINYNASFDPAMVFPETPSLRYLSSLSETENAPYRVLNVNSGMILPGLTSEINRLYSVSGYSSWVLKRLSEFTSLSRDRFQNLYRVYFTDCCDRLVDALNVKYIYTSPGTSLSALGNFRLIDHLDQAEIEAQIENGVGAVTWPIEGQAEDILFQHPPSQVDFELDVRQPAVFKTAAFIDPQAWDRPGDGVRFEVFISTGGQNPGQLVFSSYLNPQENLAHRHPIPVEIDLAPYLGQKIHLKLVTGPGPAGKIDYDWAGWVDPYIENSGPASLHLVYDGPNQIYENQAALPRAWVVHQVTPVPAGDFEAVKSRLSDPDFDFRNQAVVEQDDPAEPVGCCDSKVAHSEDGQVRIVRYLPEKVEITADVREFGLLVLADTFYPGWKVYVDGKESQIIPTNLVMRGVVLDPGRHDVVFSYQPPLLWIGLALAGLTLLGLMIALRIL